MSLLYFLEMRVETLYHNANKQTDLFARDVLVIGGHGDGVDEGAGVTGTDFAGDEVTDVAALGVEVDGGAAHLQVAHCNK